MSCPAKRWRPTWPATPASPGCWPSAAGRAPPAGSTRRRPFLSHPPGSLWATGFVVPRRRARRAAIAVRPPYGSCSRGASMPDPTSTPHHPLRPPVPPVSPPSGTDRPSALLLPDAAPAPAPPSGSHAAPPPCSCRTDDLMRRLVEGIDASLADAPPGEAVLLALTGPPPTAGPPEHVDPTGGGRSAGHRLPPGHDRLPGDVGWMPLGDAHPLEAVLGMVVPPEWQALGLVCCGQALSEPTDPAGDLPVRVTTLLTRGGKATTVLREPGGARHITEVPGGALGDALRRALELPTAPPPASSAGLWVAWWLDRIVEAAMASPQSARWPVPGRLPGSPAGWAAVAGRHPACPFAPPGRGPRPATLAAATRDLARRWPWCRLRTDPRLRVPFVVGGA